MRPAAGKARSSRSIASRWRKRSPRPRSSAMQTAPSGARRGGTPGLVQEADGGTLFLDEIGEMKPPLQAVLLRLLDDWSVRPVGGGKCRQVDVLLIAATNLDLAAAVQAGRFRADLLYRLGIEEIALPPLPARADFPAIVQELLHGIAPEWQIDDDAVAALRRHAWPGNIRELKAVLTRLTLIEATGTINAFMVPEPGAGSAEQAHECSLRAVATDRIRAVHGETAGNISETARRPGVSRNTVYRALPPDLCQRHAAALTE
ncbi:hypothetical protein CCS01_17215 [Rhodopila globiformis]|uniref:Sigma-54 factor interaction domain-containing protein n=1 Tax=Rhodopila globiformis TaxID=1071 RepID=A0A2S6NAB9_RHOGL|nr:hypothetical protein CCS01_17215 [Rhodopila globiformis]